jgi:hypothetical protein
MKKGILRELVISKESSSMIGVYCRALGDGMFLTAVQSIERSTKGEIIIFHQHDISGKSLARTSVSLEEIEMVCPFNKTYQKPLSAVLS